MELEAIHKIWAEADILKFQDWNTMHACPLAPPITMLHQLATIVYAEL